MAVFVWLFFAWPLLPPNLKTDSRSAPDTKSSSLKLCTWKKNKQIDVHKKGSNKTLDWILLVKISFADCESRKYEQKFEVWHGQYTGAFFQCCSADGIYLIFLLINKRHFKFAVQLCCGWCRTLSYRIQYNTALFI